MKMFDKIMNSSKFSWHKVSKNSWHFMWTKIRTNYMLYLSFCQTILKTFSFVCMVHACLPNGLAYFHKNNQNWLQRSVLEIVRLYMFLNYFDNMSISNFCKTKKKDNNAFGSYSLMYLYFFERFQISEEKLILNILFSRT